MNLKEFDYLLPEELIADRPPNKREESLLLVLNKNTGLIQHSSFFNLPDFFKKGDLLVKELLEKIRAGGVEVAEITLHVGLGTFLPVKDDEVEKHQMHHESYAFAKKVFQKIVEARNKKRRVIAVGTTTTRVLEDVYSRFLDNPKSVKLEGLTNIFIHPGYQFSCIDGLITNFHLPKSTLLMLVAAFAGKEKVMKMYETAIRQKYRFYSYGDAMLII